MILALHWQPQIWQFPVQVHPPLENIHSLGLPAILVPYPYAWRYQKGNADYLSNHGAAVILEDSRLGDDLVTLVKSMLADPQKLAQMRDFYEVPGRSRCSRPNC